MTQRYWLIADNDLGEREYERAGDTPRSSAFLSTTAVRLYHEEDLSLHHAPTSFGCCWYGISKRLLCTTRKESNPTSPTPSLSRRANRPEHSMSLINPVPSPGEQPVLQIYKGSSAPFRLPSAQMPDISLVLAFNADGRCTAHAHSARCLPHMTPFGRAILTRSAGRFRGHLW